MHQPPDGAADWKIELARTADRLHIIACRAAIILNPLFSINDVFTIPAQWKPFLVLRIAVTLITALSLFLRAKKKISTEVMIFIPFLSISFQNAYMYSVMDMATFQKHTFAYMALFIGAGMLILWETRYTIVISILSITVNGIFLAMFSRLSVNEIFSNGGFLMTTVMVFTVLLINNRYTLTKKEIQARLALQETNKELAVKGKIIEEKNQDILDSIRYAKRIQDAILPPLYALENLLPETFIIYKPKDIVSGDFYWISPTPGPSPLGEGSNTNSPLMGGAGGGLFLCTADCTGHGVPGAFMSMLCLSLLDDGVNEKGIQHPAQLLDHVRKGIVAALKQTGKEGEQKDGMDCALIKIPPLSVTSNGVIGKIEAAAAHNPILILRNTHSEMNIIEVKADHQPVGITNSLKPFTHNGIEVLKGDMIYLITDGFKDQFGGPDGKKFKTKKLKEVLKSVAANPVNVQKEILEKTFEEWKGRGEQTDDVTVIGIRI